MITQRIRKVGNSYVVTVPRSEMERQKLSEGDLVRLDVTPLEIRHRLPPDLQAAFDETWAEDEEAYRFLAQ